LPARSLLAPREISVELRERRRYRLALPVTYLWGGSERLLQGTGTTRDISVCSVYVTTEDLIPEGSDVWLQVTVPPIRSGARGSKLEGTGRVIRSNGRGFAAVASIGFPVDLLQESGNREESDEISVARKKAAASLAMSSE
jgi:hypothetical protein